MMQKTIFWMVFFLPLMLSAGELVDRIVAVVGTEIITLSDLKNHHVSGKKDPLEDLIREKILFVEMDRLSVSASDDDLAGAMREVLVRNKIPLEQLKEELAKKGTSFEAYKQGLRQEIRRMKFLGQVIYPRVKISEEEVTRKLGNHPNEEDRSRVRRQLVESRLSQELENYLDEVRQKTYVEIKK